MNSLPSPHQQTYTISQIDALEATLVAEKNKWSEIWTNWKCAHLTNDLKAQKKWSEKGYQNYQIMSKAMALLNAIDEQANKEGGKDARFNA